MDHEVDPSNVADARTNAKKEAEYHRAVQKWKELSAAKKWDEVVANLDVYAHSGQKVESDPRRTEQYRNDVVKVLKLGEQDTREDLTSEDIALMREVVWRKAAAFWICLLYTSDAADE